MRIAGRVVIVAALFALCGCEETLPPYTEPQQFFSARFSLSGDTVVFRHGARISGGVLRVDIVNIHDEVLDGPENIGADYELHLIEAPNERASIRVGASGLTNSRVLRGSQLTLLPRDTVGLVSQWDHRTLSGKNLWEFVALTQRFTDRGVPYLQSQPVRVSVRGQVRTFRNTAPVLLPEMQLAFVYQLY